MPEKEISLLHIVVRHWRMSVIVIFVSLGLAGLITVLLPRLYESQMKFLVNNERADLVITPEKNGASAQPSEVTETQVNSEIELLKSQDILEHIVHDANLYNTPDKPKMPRPSRLQVARATLALARSLNIAAVRKTNIISVNYRAKDPDLAVSVLSDLGDRYLSAHLAAHSAPGTYKFFTEQVDRYTHQLLRARAALSEFHRKKQLFSLPQQQSAAVEQLVSVEAQLKNVNAEIAEQHARLAESLRQLDDSPERIATQVKQAPNQFAVDHLQSMLADFRTRRIDLAMKFKPGDRLIVELDQQIVAAEQQLTSIEASRATEQTTDLDPLHQSLRADAAKSEVALKALETRRSELSAIHQSYLGQLDGMDQNNATLQNLEQYEKEALDNYTLYSRRLDEARLAESLDAQKFSNVAIIEKPVPSPIPVSPRLGLNLAVGFAVGFFLSLALSFFLEIRKGGSYAAHPVPGNAPEHPFASRAFAAGD